LKQFGKLGVLVTTASKNKILEGFSKYRVYKYLLQKFGSVYSPGKELSLDEAMIPGRG
jgi:hypothetical protein